MHEAGCRRGREVSLGAIVRGSHLGLGPWRLHAAEWGAPIPSIQVARRRQCDRVFFCKLLIEREADTHAPSNGC